MTGAAGPPRPRRRGHPRGRIHAVPSATGGCRSSISSQGRQPMLECADGKLWITFNGEIYNYRELRMPSWSRVATVSGPTATPRSCCTCTRNSGEPQCRARAARDVRVRHLRRRGPGALFVARDHLGQKPLYYTHGVGRSLLRSPRRSRRLLALDPSPARDGWRRAVRIPRVAHHHASALDVPQDPQAASRAHLLTLPQDGQARHPIATGSPEVRAQAHVLDFETRRLDELDRRDAGSRSSTTWSATCRSAHS